MSNKQLGTLAYWDIERGYGFLQPDDGSASVYVTLQDFGAAPVERMRVSFTLGDALHGYKIESIEVLDLVPAGGL